MKFITINPYGGLAVKNLTRKPGEGYYDCPEGIVQENVNLVDFIDGRFVVNLTRKAQRESDIKAKELEMALINQKKEETRQLLKNAYINFNTLSDEDKLNLIKPMLSYMELG